jgi:hypothetical protein
LSPSDGSEIFFDWIGIVVITFMPGTGRNSSARSVDMGVGMD